MRLVAATPIAELSERQFEQQLIGTKTNPGVARMLGWRCYHTLRSKGSEAGYPDWTLVRDRVVFVECKRESGVVSEAQRAWLAALAEAGAEVYLVRPRHLDEMNDVLRRRRRPEPCEHSGLRDELHRSLREDRLPFLSRESRGARLKP